MAGGNGIGNTLNQLHSPDDVTIDSSGNIYVSDYQNNRMVKWVPGAIEGIVIISNVCQKEFMLIILKMFMLLIILDIELLNLHYQMVLTLIVL